MTETMETLWAAILDNFKRNSIDRHTVTVTLLAPHLLALVGGTK